MFTLFSSQTDTDDEILHNIEMEIQDLELSLQASDMPIALAAIPNGTIPISSISNGSLLNDQTLNSSISNCSISNGFIPNGSVLNRSHPKKSIINNLTPTVSTKSNSSILNSVISSGSISNDLISNSLTSIEKETDAGDEILRNIQQEVEDLELSIFESEKSIGLDSDRSMPSGSMQNIPIPNIFIYNYFNSNGSIPVKNEANGDVTSSPLDKFKPKLIPVKKEANGDVTYSPLEKLKLNLIPVKKEANGDVTFSPLDKLNPNGERSEFLAEAMLQDIDDSIPESGREKNDPSISKRWPE